MLNDDTSREARGDPADGSPDIVARIDRELRHVYVDPVVATIGVPLALCARWAAEVPAVFASGKPCRFELPVGSGAALRHFESQLLPELGADGAVQTILAIARDVSARRSGQAALEAEQRHRRALVTLAEALPHPLRIYDRQLATTFANAASEDFPAIESDELRRVFDTAISASSRVEAARAADRVVYETHAVPVLSDAGTVESVVWLALEVAERDRAANEDAYAAARQRNALVREVHHRVKNNLQGVVGLLRQLANRDDALQPVLGKAIVQLQAIAVIHGLQGQALRENVPITGMIEEIASSVGRATGVDIRYDRSAAEADVMVCVKENEAVTIALVLNELMMNASKHRRENGRVEVSSTLHSKRALIEVSNQGWLAGAFDYAHDVGLGTGLELVKALLPAHGVHLSFAQHAGCVKATLEIASPVLAAETEPPENRDDWDRRKRPHSDRRR